MAAIEKKEREIPSSRLAADHLKQKSRSLKVKNIQHNNKVSFCVDDQTPSFSFVTVYGTAKIRHHKHNELFKWATKIAGRYMDKDDTEAYGKRNSGEGEVLVHIKPTRIISEKNIAAWD